jgi:hypothetical protein
MFIEELTKCYVFFRQLLSTILPSPLWTHSPTVPRCMVVTSTWYFQPSRANSTLHTPLENQKSAASGVCPLMKETGLVLLVIFTMVSQMLPGLVFLSCLRGRNSLITQKSSSLKRQHLWSINRVLCHNGWLLFSPSEVKLTELINVYNVP